MPYVTTRLPRSKASKPVSEVMVCTTSHAWMQLTTDSADST
ncbi:Uncharacterised protein [Bordetella pertussis]|nr:Uncharacterised protein [Bordetella pertussis]